MKRNRIYAGLLAALIVLGICVFYMAQRGEEKASVREMPAQKEEAADRQDRRKAVEKPDQENTWETEGKDDANRDKTPQLCGINENNIYSCEQ